MRYVGIVAAMLAAWGGLTLLTTTGLSSKPLDDPSAKFDALVVELQQAHSNYLDARREAAERTGGDHGTKVQTSIVDRRADIMREMDALADASIGTPGGADVAIGTFNWSWQLDADLDRLVKRFARLVEHYPNHPDLVDPVSSVARAYAAAGSPSEWVALLDKLARTTRDEDSRIGALYIMGQVQMSSGSLADAKGTFNRIISAYADSEYVPRVRGLIYEIDNLLPGMTAPEFTTKTIDGEAVSLASLRGKIVLLNFWATWCPSCVSEIPHLREAYAKLRGDDRPFEIVNVSLDDELPALKSVLRHLDMPGVQTWDRIDGANPVGKQYNVYGLPSWFLIDDKGVIRARNPFGDALASNVAAIRE